MADNHDLLILPNQGDSSIVLSDGRSSLFARGRKELSNLLKRREVLYLAKVKVNGRWGYIDRTGQFVIDPEFEGAGDFSENLAYVVVKHIYGFIDKTGTIVIEPQFDEANSFSEGLAAVEIDKIGFIDK